MGDYWELTDKKSGEKHYILVPLGEEAANKALKELIKDQNSLYVFRKMSQAEFTKTVQQGGILQPKNPLRGEKWITEDLIHTRNFQNRGVPSGTLEKVAEIKVKKGPYNELRNKNTIPQRNFNQNVSGDNIFNVYNKERLTEVPGKINIGLKGQKNVNTFNKTVRSIKAVDPESVWRTNKGLALMSRSGVKVGAAGIGIILIGTDLIISIVNDGRTWGHETTMSVAGISGGIIGDFLAGMAAGALALGSVSGGVLAILGGVIGALVGAGIASAIFAVPLSLGGKGQYDMDLNPVSKGQGPSGLNSLPQNQGNLGLNPQPSGQQSLGLNPIPWGEGAN